MIAMLFKSKINIKFYKIFMFTIAGAFVIVYLYRMFIGTGDIVVLNLRTISYSVSFRN